MSMIPPSSGPRPFAQTPIILPAGTTGSVLISAKPISLYTVTNGYNAPFGNVSLSNAASTGAVTAANTFFNQQTLGTGQIYTFNYQLVGLVITFSTPTLDTITIGSSLPGPQF